MKPSKLESILCKQWTIEFAKMGNIELTEVPNTLDFNLKFNPDGTYEVKSPNDDNSSGTWTYDVERRTVELEAAGNVKFMIKSITKDNLIINLDLGEDAPPGLSNLELHFKPS
ncbi:copper resistance protein NlpE [Psychroflexus sp. CAK8W]|uniref:Copper resistance protein NlpE n=1 Tax=Psychroflexus longus TaxID=2873596 RepID=A0ABS7XKQ5_9FLAO|nr:copper resistance protein NlpE [Psychroflexus longus]MBZ9778431.1 copper resistance protein NlpE [Psychroflexus longus]